MENKIKVGIIGASGYMGLELIRILSLHPKVKINLITSEKYKGISAASVFPSLTKICDNRFEAVDLKNIIKNCELVFTALPHQEAMKLIPSLLKEKIKVVDLSADYRLKNHQTYEKWYGSTHTSPELLSEAVYGLPEINREKIKNARLIANPGCYPTSIILGLAPLLKSKLDLKNFIIIDSKSGVSGAGRSSEVTYNFNECNENIRAYNVNKHRHTPEIEQELSATAGKEIKVTFTPHLIPLTRGILSTIYVKTEKINLDELKNIYKDFYGDTGFIRIQEDKSPEVHNVRGSNYCDIGLFPNEEVNMLTIISAIDNLIKGGSGQAVQNMNIMHGFAENTGLTQVPLFP